MSNKVIVNAAGVATASTPVIADVFTTLLSMDTALTGTYGLVQKVALVGAGMVAQNQRLGRGINIFASTAP